MIDKLRSHLRSERGFTLIELLVVIAIIAILVVIVVVAINPVQRLQDANNRTASSNVRAAGTLVSTCITQQLAANVATGTVFDNNGATAGSCVNTSVIGNFGNLPSGVVVLSDDADNICVYADNPSGSGDFRYQSITGGIEGPSSSSLNSCP